MRTNEERIQLVRQRTAERKRKMAQGKRRALDAVWTTVLLMLVVVVGALMPTLTARVTESGMTHASGAASLIGEHAALGYILMGLLAFLLGVCVTVCLYRLRRRDERRRREDSDEL